MQGKCRLQSILWDCWSIVPHRSTIGPKYLIYSCDFPPPINLSSWVWLSNMISYVLYFLTKIDLERAETARKQPQQLHVPICLRTWEHLSKLPFHIPTRPLGSRCLFLNSRSIAFVRTTPHCRFAPFGDTFIFQVHKKLSSKHRRDKLTKQKTVTPMTLLLVGIIHSVRRFVNADC